MQNGGLAQLARALAWHARGHRFDPGILHTIRPLRAKALPGSGKAFFMDGPDPIPGLPIRVLPDRLRSDIQDSESGAETSADGRIA